MILNTKRLTIREYRKEDLQDLYEIFSDPEVMENCEPSYDFRKSEEFLDYCIKNPIAYAVVENKYSKVIGHALFKQLPGEEEGIYEIGWIYNRSFWRKGYAYEASKALVNYGFDVLHIHKICAETIDPLKSVSLMKKLGMCEEGVLRKHVLDNNNNWADLYWYGILNTDL